ncbi:MAG: SPOR domain-containing protein [Gammaproteobacteria bacterium]|nr:SPOR domain-containing protein [Gammaproteobacteria bacterium]
MRWLILFMLLLNGGFFAWQYFANQDQELAQTSNHSGEYDPLTLLTELDDEQKKMLGIVPIGDPLAAPAEMPASELQPEAAKPEVMAKKVEEPVAAEPKPEPETMAVKPPTKEVAKPEPKVEPKPAAVCYTLGPVKTEKALRQVEARVKAMGLDIDKARRADKQESRHWLYIDGIKSDAEARQLLDRLKYKGFKDTQLIRKKSGIKLSVGLFSTKSGADNRLKRLQDAGFAPVMATVKVKKKQYWLDVKNPQGKKADEAILKSLIRGNKGAKVAKRDCK